MRRRLAPVACDRPDPSDDQLTTAMLHADIAIA